MVWLGPAEEDCTNDFLRFFLKKACMDVGSFQGIDEPDKILAHKQAYALRRGCADFDADTKAIDCLCPSGREFVEESVELMLAGKKRGRFGGVACDSSQNPKKRHRAGPFMPAVQKSSVMVGAGEGVQGGEDDCHIFTSDEISFLHGWPTHKVVHERLRACLNYDLSAAPLSLQSRILGDGMSIIAVQAFLLYVMAHTVRRAPFEKMPPSLHHSTVRPLHVLDDLVAVVVESESEELELEAQAKLEAEAEGEADAKEPGPELESQSQPPVFDICEK